MYHAFFAPLHIAEEYATSIAQRGIIAAIISERNFLGKFFKYQIDRIIVRGRYMMILSQVFLVTFSILYGIMLNGCLGLSISPFGRLFGFETCKPRLRIFVSFFVINLLPFVIFSLVLPWIGHLEVSKDTQNPLNFLGIFFLSMIVFAPYRLLQICITFCKGRWLYDFEKEKLSYSRKEHIKMVANSSWKGHAIGCLFYVVLFVIGLYLTLM